MRRKKINQLFYFILKMLFSMFLLASCTQTKRVITEGSATKTDVSNKTSNLESSENHLALSQMVVQIRCADSIATFQLYDTTAAKQFYHQLPLILETENFQNAQWMFYPPEKLDVKPDEAYHDGLKGELSYYEPWGDMFVLYADFNAGDEMHRLGKCLSGIDELSKMDGTISIEKVEHQTENPQIQVEANDKTIIFELNDSTAAKALYNQLPMTKYEE